MKNQAQYSVLVIGGQWNYAIFNPEWVSKYLIPNTKLNVEIPLSAVASMKISTDELSIFVVEGKLNIQIIKHSDDILVKIGDIASQIADYLPHTPVSAFGLNYVFEEQHSVQMDKLFSFCDSDKLDATGHVLEASIITRRMKKEDYILTLMIARNDTNYNCNFNYNFPISSLAEFKTKFESQQLVKFKKYSLSLLSDLYNFELL